MTRPTQTDRDRRSTLAMHAARTEAVCSLARKGRITPERCVAELECMVARVRDELARAARPLTHA